MLDDLAILVFVNGNVGGGARWEAVCMLYEQSLSRVFYEALGIQ